MKVLLISLNAKYIHSSLALYSIQAACLASQQPAETLEYTINQDFLHILADIAGRRPDVAGIACYIWNRELVLNLAAALKKVLPATSIVLGGPEASGDAAAILRTQPAVDFVVQGEGEASFPELLAELAQGRAGRDVGGVAVRCDDGVELNGGARVVENLDDLPFAYREEMMPGLANRIIYYESSRGCPFDCSYCVSSLTRGVRQRSAAKVKTELRFLLEQGVKQVKFVDRTFNVLPEHYQEIWRFLAGADTKTNFHFEIVADLLSPAEVEWLTRVAPGRFQFEIGVQSLCPATLKAIGRHNAWERLRDNVQMLQRAGNIHLHLDLIIGLPEEDLESFRESFNAVYNLQPAMLQVGFLKLLPGTRIRRDAAQYGYVWLEHTPYEILANQQLPYPAVRRLKLLEEVFSQTYNSGRFSRVLAFLVRFCAAGDAFAFYQALTDWWERKGLVGRAHSPEGVLSRLLDYSEQLPAPQTERVGDLLKFETMLDDAGALKGEKLDWNATRWERRKADLWRNEEKLRRYIPDYRFSNWREVKRDFPMEVFRCNLPQWLDHGEWPERGLTTLLFDRRRAAWHCLDRQEFLVEDES